MTRFTIICISLIVVSLIFVGISYAAINPENAAGIWLFDESSGDTASDSSDNDNDGRLMNSPQRVDGKEGKALSFDGSDDYVIISASTMMDPYPYTFSAWVKLDKYNPDANTGAVVMGNYDGTDSIFYISNTGRLSIRVHPPSFW